MTMDKGSVKTETKENFMDSVFNRLTENSDNPKLFTSLTDKQSLVQRVIDHIICDSSPPAESNAKPFSILCILLRDSSGCEAVLNAEFVTLIARYAALELGHSPSDSSNFEATKCMVNLLTQFEDARSSILNTPFPDFLLAFILPKANIAPEYLERAFLCGRLLFLLTVTSSQSLDNWLKRETSRQTMGTHVLDSLILGILGILKHIRTSSLDQDVYILEVLKILFNLSALGIDASAGLPQIRPSLISECCEILLQFLNDLQKSDLEFQLPSKCLSACQVLMNFLPAWLAMHETTHALVTFLARDRIVENIIYFMQSFLEPYMYAFKGNQAMTILDHDPFSSRRTKDEDEAAPIEAILPPLCILLKLYSTHGGKRCRALIRNALFSQPTVHGEPFAISQVLKSLMTAIQYPSSQFCVSDLCFHALGGTDDAFIAYVGYERALGYMTGMAHQDALSSRPVVPVQENTNSMSTKLAIEEEGEISSSLLNQANDVEDREEEVEGEELCDLMRRLERNGLFQIHRQR